MSWIFEGSSAQIDEVIRDIPHALEGLIKGDTTLTTTKKKYFDCCLCLEKHCSKGIACSGTRPSSGGNETKVGEGDSNNINEEAEKLHFICQQCFSPYVSSLCDESFKLLDNGGQITCPVPECCSRPWSSHDVRHAVVGNVLEKYIDILVLSLQRATKNKKNNSISSSSSNFDKSRNSQSDVLKPPDERRIQETSTKRRAHNRRLYDYKVSQSIMQCGSGPYARWVLCDEVLLVRQAFLLVVPLYSI